jgi:hypothetical protein
VHFSSNAKHNHEHRVLGCAARPTRKKLVNQADAILEERRLRILSHMTAPVMLKAFHLATETSACVGASKNKRESYEVSEPDNIVEEDDHTWYVVPDVLSCIQPLPIHPICVNIVRFVSKLYSHSK